MHPPLSPADRVLQTTLQHVRRERSRRRLRRATLAAVLPAAAAAWCVSAWLQPAAISPVHISVAQNAVSSSVDDKIPDTLAVLVVRDDTAIFEQRQANELSDVNVSLSLEPVIARVW